MDRNGRRSPRSGRWRRRVQRAVSIVYVALLTGCVSKGVVVDVLGEVSRNPRTGVALRIDRIEDLRVFVELPKKPKRKDSDPSTWASQETHIFVPQITFGDIRDPTLTARAIGLARGEGPATPITYQSKPIHRELPEKGDPAVPSRRTAGA